MGWDWEGNEIQAADRGTNVNTAPAQGVSVTAELSTVELKQTKNIVS